MKRYYIAPQTDVENVGMMPLMDGSGNQVTSVEDNLGNEGPLNYGGAGNGSARSNDNGNLWDED